MMFKKNRGKRKKDKREKERKKRKKGEVAFISAVQCPIGAPFGSH